MTDEEKNKIQKLFERSYEQGFMDGVVQATTTFAASVKLLTSNSFIEISIEKALKEKNINKADFLGENNE